MVKGKFLKKNPENITVKQKTKQKKLKSDLYGQPKMTFLLMANNAVKFNNYILCEYVLSWVVMNVWRVPSFYTRLCVIPKLNLKGNLWYNVSCQAY